MNVGTVKLEFIGLVICSGFKLDTTFFINAEGFQNKKGNMRTNGDNM